MTRRRKNKTVLKRNPTPSKLGADVVAHARRNPLRNASDYQWDGFEGLRKYLGMSNRERADELLSAMYRVPDEMQDAIQERIDDLRAQQPAVAAEAQRLFDEVTEDESWDEAPEQISQVAVDGPLHEILLDILESDQTYALDQIDDDEKPSWFFLALQSVNTDPSWLVHCTDEDPYAVVTGFEGIEQVDKLGLTTHLDKSLYEPSSEGFGFAFEEGSFNRYGGSPCKYGRREVAIRVKRHVVAWHYTDEEPQAIFWAPDIEQGFEVESDRTRYGRKYYFPDPNLIEYYDVEVPEPFESLDDMAAWIEAQEPELRDELFLKETPKSNPRRSGADLAKLKRRLMR